MHVALCTVPLWYTSPLTWQYSDGHFLASVLAVARDLASEVVRLGGGERVHDGFSGLVLGGSREFQASYEALESITNTLWSCRSGQSNLQETKKKKQTNKKNKKKLKEQQGWPTSPDSGPVHFTVPNTRRSPHPEAVSRIGSA